MCDVALCFEDVTAAVHVVRATRARGHHGSHGNSIIAAILGATAKNAVTGVGAPS